MDSDTSNNVLPDEFINSMIYVIRDKKAMLVEDLTKKPKSRQQYLNKVGVR